MWRTGTWKASPTSPWAPGGLQSLRWYQSTLGCPIHVGLYFYVVIMGNSEWGQKSWPSAFRLADQVRGGNGEALQSVSGCWSGRAQAHSDRWRSWPGESRQGPQLRTRADRKCSMQAFLSEYKLFAWWHQMAKQNYGCFTQGRQFSWTGGKQSRRSASLSASFYTIMWLGPLIWKLAKVEEEHLPKFRT